MLPPSGVEGPPPSVCVLSGGARWARWRRRRLGPAPMRSRSWRRAVRWPVPSIRTSAL